MSVLPVLVAKLMLILEFCVPLRASLSDRYARKTDQVWLALVAEVPLEFAESRLYA
jgi:hypothetical protein